MKNKKNNVFILLLNSFGITKKIKLIYNGPKAFRFSTSGFLNQKRRRPKNKNIAQIVTRFTAFFFSFLKY